MSEYRAQKVRHRDKRVRRFLAVACRISVRIEVKTFDLSPHGRSCSSSVPLSAPLFYQSRYLRSKSSKIVEYFELLEICLTFGTLFAALTEELAGEL